jgi:2-keto-4-pentenoate hydratase/2-oxohepta-3-ene-1,7-dioic acid hydratase in catechol pathway
MFSLVQFRVPGSMKIGVGVYDGTIVRSLAPSADGMDLMGLLQDWASWSDYLENVDADTLEHVSDARLIAPLTFPRKILCAGVNYYDHAREMKVVPPDPAADPFFFLKTPTTTIVGPFDDIRIGDDSADCFDWEVELGVVISTKARDVRAEDTAGIVAGYVVSNDISARGLFSREAGPPFDLNWLAQKNQDDSCPIGPGLMPAWHISDPQNLTMSLQVNGEVKQKSNTSQMVVDVANLIAGASRVTTLEPGDLILTGTPAGVGLPRNTFLAHGDVVTVEIEGIGRIVNRIVTRGSTS